MGAHSDRRGTEITARFPLLPTAWMVHRSGGAAKVMPCLSQGLWLLMIAMHLQCATPSAPPPSRPPAPLLGIACGRISSDQSSTPLAFLGALGCSELASRETTLQLFSLWGGSRCSAACSRLATAEKNQPPALGLAMSYDVRAGTMRWGRGNALSSHNQLRKLVQQPLDAGANFVRSKQPASSRMRGGPPLSVCAPVRHVSAAILFHHRARLLLRKMCNGKLCDE